MSGITLRFSGNDTQDVQALERQDQREVRTELSINTERNFATLTHQGWIGDRCSSVYGPLLKPHTCSMLRSLVALGNAGKNKTER